VPYLRTKTGLPIVAAGGISTGAQMAAAIAIGACAVIVGTRLIATPEARVVPAYKQAVVTAGPEDIVTTSRLTGNPATWLASSIAGVDRSPDLNFKRWRDVWSAGQSVAQVEAIKPASEVVREMVEDYVRACRELEQTLWDSS